MNEMRELDPQPLRLGELPAWTFDALPAVGAPAPAFTLPDAAFKVWTLDDFANRPVLLGIAPTFETPAGRDDLRNLVRIAAAHPELACIGVSVDLPFALVRVLDETRPPENVTLLSAFRSPEFGMEYGTLLVDHPMMGLLARALLLLDPAHRIAWTHLVPDVLSAPDWPALESRLG